MSSGGEAELLGLALQTGGAGIGVSGLVYALYVHFTNRFDKAEKDKLEEEKIQLEKAAQEQAVRLEQDKQKALESAERNKKIELTKLQSELNKQRLDTHGELITKLLDKIDNLADNVSALTADIRAVAAIQNHKDNHP